MQFNKIGDSWIHGYISRSVAAQSLLVGCSGAMAETKELKILQPDDFHHHFRDEPFLEHTVPFGWEQLSQAIAKTEATQYDSTRLNPT